MEGKRGKYGKIDNVVFVNFFGAPCVRLIDSCPVVWIGSAKQGFDRKRMNDKVKASYNLNKGDR
jgi:hypothetical protein